jgi:hypothetical protein
VSDCCYFSLPQSVTAAGWYAAACEWVGKEGSTTSSTQAGERSSRRLQHRDGDRAASTTRVLVTRISVHATREGTVAKTAEEKSLCPCALSAWMLSDPSSLDLRPFPSAIVCALHSSLRAGSTRCGSTDSRREEKAGRLQKKTAILCGHEGGHMCLGQRASRSSASEQQQQRQQHQLQQQ